MTNERAIELLHRLQDEQFDGIHGDERREALEMAMRALVSQQIVNDSQGLVKDFISRQAAMVVFENSGLDDDSKDTAVRVLEQLPSAQQEITEDDVKEYCRKRCLIVVTSDFYNEMYRRWVSAQPERKRGYWIDMDSDLEKYDDIKCSCCKHEFTVDAYHWTDIGFIKDDLNFCPNCGADMRGGSDEID